jgi:hypothetical protein
MADFPITKRTPAAWFKELLGPSGPYFSKLKSDLRDHPTLVANNKEGIFDDYAAIGSFLSDSSAVLECLVPLEVELRSEVEARAKQASPQDIGAIIRSAAQGQNSVFKTHKLLTNALEKSEIAAGFNNPEQTLATLHSQALEFDTANQQWNKRYDSSSGKRVAQKVTLPKGVPTVVGDLDTLSFNNILLRHGYQFKDVGAAPEHGEYTHRLQWYAIGQAKKLKKIELNNEPLQIFKSMGLLLAGADRLKGSGLHLYIWELLFDCAESAGRAKGRSTKAWSDGTFNCPETVTTSLCKRDAHSVDPDKVSDLYYLRTLIDTRRNKRWAEAPGKPGERDYLTKTGQRLGANRANRIYSGFDMDTIEKTYPNAADLLSPAANFGRAGLLAWFVKA